MHELIEWFGDTLALVSERQVLQFFDENADDVRECLNCMCDEGDLIYITQYGNKFYTLSETSELDPDEIKNDMTALISDEDDLAVTGDAILDVLPFKLGDDGAVEVDDDNIDKNVMVLINATERLGALSQSIMRYFRAMDLWERVGEDGVERIYFKNKKGRLQ